MIRFPTIWSHFSVLYKSGQAKTNQGSGTVTEAGDGGLWVMMQTNYPAHGWRRTATTTKLCRFQKMSLAKAGNIMTRATTMLAVSHPEGITSHDFWCVSHCHNKWSKIGTEEKFGGSVASMIWNERQAIEITTRIYVSVRNYVVHAWQRSGNDCFRHAERRIRSSSKQRRVHIQRSASEFVLFPNVSSSRSFNRSIRSVPKYLNEFAITMSLRTNIQPQGVHFSSYNGASSGTGSLESSHIGYNAEVGQRTVVVSEASDLHCQL